MKYKNNRFRLSTFIFQLLNYIKYENFFSLKTYLYLNKEILVEESIGREKMLAMTVKEFLDYKI